MLTPPCYAAFLSPLKVNQLGRVTLSEVVADFSLELEVTKIHTLDRTYLKLTLHASPV